METEIIFKIKVWTRNQHGILWDWAYTEGEYKTYPEAEAAVPNALSMPDTTFPISDCQIDKFFRLKKQSS